MKRWLPFALLFVLSAIGWGLWNSRPPPPPPPPLNDPFEPPLAKPKPAPSTSACLKSHPPKPPTKSTGWRGDGTGRYPDAHPPVRWSVTENLRWKAPLPAPGSGTPVPVGDRVFVTAEPNRLLAFSAADGHLLWEREASALDALTPEERAQAEALAAQAPALREQLTETWSRLVQLKREARTPKPRPDIAAEIARVTEEHHALEARVERAELFGRPVNWRDIGNASATPVSDGESVYVVFGTFVVASFDLDGNRRWIRYLPHAEERRREQEQLHVGGSPLLVGDRLVVPMVELYGLDPATGKTLWTGPRYHHFGTPRALRIENADVIVTAGGALICAEDGVLLSDELRDGQQLAPVLTERLIVVPGFFGNSGTSKIEAWPIPKLSELTEDRVTPSPIWTKNLGTAEYWGTPLVIDTRIVGLDTKAHFNVIDSETGAVLETRETTNGFGGGAPSPVLAGDRLYLTSNDGTTMVLEAQPPYATLARNALPGDTRATLAVQESALYLRTSDALYCVGEP